MSRLKDRVSKIERQRGGPKRPLILDFPTEGMSEAEIEAEIARSEARGPMTDDEWAEKYCVQTTKTGH